MCLTLAGSPANSQSHATITGTVLDETGGVLPGVAVELTGVSDERTTTADDNGTFLFEKVATGPATVTFRLINFSTFRRDVN
ncbi:MAG: carboxypeptidase-like regulatory domain-containing protein, partial [Acidobacteriota bacterium]|nr:carboxypeptidase-like regulatory domain-containing protein [Acidobacteriota bacterium]